MAKLQTKKEINSLAILLMFTYMISYITRINYGAIVAELEHTEKISKSLLSMAVTGSFITYGTGQIISGICGDKVSPKKLIACGFIVTVLMNLLIPICTNPYQMTAVWCVNGFAQSFMWPPMVKMMTALLSDDDYKKVNVIVSWGCSFGTIIVYLFSPVIIALFNWKAVFIFSAICGIIMLLFWNKFALEIDMTKAEKLPKDKQKGTRIFSPVMIFIMLAIVCQGMLRDGVTTWMPTYICETYNLSSIISILTGVLLPVFSIIIYKLTGQLYRKKFTNPLSCTSIIFSVGAISALALCIFTGKNAALSVFFSALLTGAMHGVNFILVGMIPPFFKKTGNVSSVSGILNSCTYIGSAISTYGVALLSENFGWGYTLGTWLIVGMFGVLLCLISIKPFRKYM